MLRTGDQVDADGTVGNAIADGADVISRKGDPTFVGKTGLGTAALDLVIDGSASIGSEQIYSAQIIDERIAFRQHRLGRQRISEPKPRVVTDHCRHSISRNVRRLTLRSARKTPKTLERAIAHGTTRTQMIHASETGIGSAAPIAIESQPADVCRRTYHA